MPSAFQDLQWAKPRYYRWRPLWRDCHKESVPQQLKLMKYSCVAPSSAVPTNEQATLNVSPTHPTNQPTPLQPYYGASLACLQLARYLPVATGQTER